jgi:uncharacterized protein YndB with AHSA1/START domain
MHQYGNRIAPDTVRLERLLPGPLERVWSFLTESDKRARWLASGPMDLVAGGKVELHFAHHQLSHERTPEKYGGAPMSFTGEVLRCEPPRLLTFTWMEFQGVHSEVTFELVPHGDQVMLTITHRKLPDRPSLVSVASGWDAHVGVLEDALLGRAPRGFWSTHAQLEAEYGRRFAE